MAHWILAREHLPLGQGTLPVGPPGLASSTPVKPGPDGPGYYLTALRALCVANPPVATDSVLLGGRIVIEMAYF